MIDSGTHLLSLYRLLFSSPATTDDRYRFTRLAESLTGESIALGTNHPRIPDVRLRSLGSERFAGLGLGLSAIETRGIPRVIRAGGERGVGH